MGIILNDHSRFKKCKDYDSIYNYNVNLEDKINYFLRKIKKLGNITEDEYKQLYVNGSSPSILYGLPKVHKANIPMRPILSAYKKPSYKLAKFVIPSFSPYINNDFTLKNSYDFKNILENKKFPQSAILTSFDVTSLFTNVPVKETIDIATECMYGNGGSFRNMSKKNFGRLLELCTLDNHFLFNNQHFSQFEGFAMGNPISATMANLFLSFHEKNWLDNCPLEFKPLIYRRYVDDCFIIFKERSHAPKFLEYLNVQHNNIKFTMEIETENELNFLDCNVKKNAIENFVTLIFSVFRKPTFTSLGMNYHSNTFFNFKLNNIRTLLHRAYEITSNWSLFDNELKFLLDYFTLNGYPRNLCFRIAKGFIDKKVTPRAVKLTAEKMNFYHSVPFINNYVCHYVKKNLLKFLENSYPQINFHLIFSNTFTTHGLVKHKDKLPRTLESSIVYSYICGDCNATYIGSSVKTLRARASEHFALSSRTGNMLAKPPPSRIMDHILTCKSRKSFEDFNILDTQKDVQSLRISETLEILKRKPSLNDDQTAYPLYLS